jgi:flagellar basal body rod protein FlgG
MRPDSLRTAADALRYWELRQQAASNNLANVETPGFKGERVFARLLEGASPVATARTDMRQGALRPTDNPLDVAIENERQFFVVDTPAGERLIRGGALRLDANGVLVHASGRALLGDNGPIAVPPGATIAIEADGTVRADGNVIDRLRVDAIAGPEDIVHEAGGIFRPAGTRASVSVAERAIHQGFMEESNVDTLTSMVEMIEIQRAYAAVQGSMRSIDSVMETIANDIGRVG